MITLTLANIYFFGFFFLCGYLWKSSRRNSGFDSQRKIWSTGYKTWVIFKQSKLFSNLLLLAKVIFKSQNLILCIYLVTMTLQLFINGFMLTMIWHQWLHHCLLLSTIISPTAICLLPVWFYKRLCVYLFMDTCIFLFMCV